MQFRGPGDDGDDPDDSPERGVDDGASGGSGESLETAPPDAAGDTTTEAAASERAPGFPPGWETVNARLSREAADAEVDREHDLDWPDRSAEPQGERQDAPADETHEGLADLFGDRTSLEEALREQTDGSGSAREQLWDRPAERSGDGSPTAAGTRAGVEPESLPETEPAEPDPAEPGDLRIPEAESDRPAESRQSAGQSSRQTAGQSGSEEADTTSQAAGGAGTGPTPAARSAATSGPGPGLSRRSGGAATRWWYGVAALPLYIAVAAPLLAMLWVGGSTFDASGLGVYAWLLAASLGFVFVAIPGIVLVTLFPVALYLDAGQVAADPAVDWEPDAALHGILALVGLVAGGVGAVLLGLLYLHRRHRAVGRP